jgi:hypothetical protein
MADDFVAATHAQLARLADEARTARRNRPAHAWCLCKHCARIARISAEINDYLDQLDEAPPVWNDRDPIVDRTDAEDCSICGRGRYMNLAGAIACMTCDGWPLGRWVNMVGESVERETAD